MMYSDLIPLNNLSGTLSKSFVSIYCWMLLKAIKVLLTAINYSKVINDTIDAVYQVQPENLNVIASTMIPLSLSSLSY